MDRILLFDLDGTLTDSREGIVKSVRYALEKLSLPIPPEDRPSVSEGLQRWSARWSDSLDSAMSGFNDFFSGLGRWTPPPQGGN